MSRADETELLEQFRRRLSAIEAQVPEPPARDFARTSIRRRVDDADRRRVPAFVALLAGIAVLAVVLGPLLLGALPADRGASPSPAGGSAAPQPSLVAVPTQQPPSPASPSPSIEPTPPPALVGNIRGIPAGPLVGRSHHSAVWTGSEMIVWGGLPDGGEPLRQGIPIADGAAYDPATETWRPISSGLLAARFGHSAVWTGTEMIVWGGNAGHDGGIQADGAAYDPATDGWRLISSGPAGRTLHTAVWTGTEMIVWGGVLASGQPRADGAAYDPATDTWRDLPPLPVEPRSAHSAVWTGDAMIAWGGDGPGPGNELDDGLLYDPTDQSGTRIGPDHLVRRAGHSTVWTGERMIVWGGTQGRPSARAPFNDGLAYDPSTGTWWTLNLVPAPGRFSHSAIWTGSEMLVWGGRTSVSGEASADGFAYDPGALHDCADLTELPPISDDSSIDPANEVAEIMFQAEGAVDQMVRIRYPDQACRQHPVLGPYIDHLFGGQATPQPPPDPTPPGTPGLPAAASVPVDERVVRSPIEGTVSANGVWTGEEVIVWGGVHGDEDGLGLAGLSRAGAAYDPVADSWREIDPAGVARAGYLAVWTGNEMLIWGGYGTGGVLSNGAAYDPRSDRWRDLAPAPAEWAAGYARALDNDSTNFASVWTGSEWVLAYGWVGDEEYDIAHMAAYDPAADRWRELPTAPISRTEGIELAWTGSELILASPDVVSRLPAEADEWEPVSETPWGLAASSLTWIGDRVLAVVTWWGPDEAWRFLASWDPATDSWQALPQPPSSFGGSLLWDGRHAIGYGSGLAYDTVTDVWLELPLADERMDTVRIWTGGELLIWGGWDCGLCPAGVYDEGLLLTPRW